MGHNLSCLLGQQNSRAETRDVEARLKYSEFVPAYECATDSPGDLGHHIPMDGRPGQSGQMVRRERG